MLAWHAGVAAVNGDAMVLLGPRRLAEGVDTARVKITIGKKCFDGLAAAIGSNEMAVIVSRSEFEPQGTGQEVDVLIGFVNSQLRTPPSASQSLMHVDSRIVDKDQDRWVRQALLFALEAQAPTLRAKRLAMLLEGAERD